MTLHLGYLGSTETPVEALEFECLPVAEMCGIIMMASDMFVKTWELNWIWHPSWKISEKMKDNFLLARFWDT